MHKKPDISFIICSHNRASTLEISLEKYENLNKLIQHEVLIVLNACSDNSLEVVKKAASSNDAIRWVEEPNIGHTNARNRGWKEAMADFVFYIDDDAYPDTTILSCLINAINYPVDCVSGRTIYWPLNSPKWILPEYVEVPKFGQEFKLMPDYGYINGCACGFTTKALEAIGGFNPDIGMRGKELGYADEVEVQYRLQQKGFKVYYDPNMLVYHQSHQKKAVDFLRSSYSKGQSKSRIAPINKFRSYLVLVREFIRALILFPIRIITIGYKRAIVESFQTPFNILGQVTA